MRSLRVILLGYLSLPVVAFCVTSPKTYFGHEVGEDYYLSNYQQLSGYWRLLDKESPRLVVESIGKTAEGRDQLMAIVSSPQNLARREEYRQIARRLCLARGVSQAEAGVLAHKGKAVVWIDGGLHATETLGAQQLIQTLYLLAQRDDEETRRILDNTIILLVHANPDGMDLVSDWYMKDRDPLKRNLNIPRLYQKYIGHDNNRDSYAVTQAETQNMSRIMYRTWYPQVMYNHHQSGPSGTVMFAPPFRDPINHRVDPQVVSGIGLVGAAMMERFLRKDMPGVTTDTGAPYSMWWNGGLRTTSCFHNMIGILTETIGNPTPIRIPFSASRRVMQNNLLWPIEPQEWHLRQSVNYSVEANFAILDLVARYKDKFLYDIYTMGRRQIEMGSRDTWTDTPSKVANAKAMADLRKPEQRNPRGYVISSDQGDFPSAKRFVNALIATGVEVIEAPSSFSLGGNRYPAGSLIIPCDQAFRPHVLDMFEPQDYPNDVPAPGAPPTPPYDSAGYTPAFQAGIDFDRILDGSARVFAPLSGFLSVERRPWRERDGALPMTANVNYEIAFERLKRGEKASAEGGMIRFDGAGTPLRMPRIGLWDRYGGSIASGWIRWIFDSAGVPFKQVFPPELDNGKLRESYDVLIFPDGAVSARLSDVRGDDRTETPEEFRQMRGSISRQTVPKLREFVESGGVIVCIGSSVALGAHLGLPVSSALETEGKPLSRTEFYIPGSVVRVRLETNHPVCMGMRDEADMMFDESPALRINGKGVVPLGTYAQDLLRSGWALGGEKIVGAVAMAEAKIGMGKIYLFCPEITFRGQSSGTFKLLFNALLLPAE
jgi:hypothetical protein